MAAEAQPPEGQDPGSGGLYDSYLQFVPPDRQEDARAHLEEVSRSVNGRLEEAASLRTQYEPYQQVPGFDSYTPEEMGQLFAWHQNIAASPDTFRDWLLEASREQGLMVSEQERLEQAAYEPDDDVRNLQQQFEQQIQPLQDRIDELSSQQFQNAEAALINDRFAQIEADNNLQLSDQQRDIIVRLGLSAMPEDGQALVNGNDWIGAGWEAFRDVWAQAQNAFVTDKAAAPPPALESGGSEIAHGPKTWDEARRSAAERLRQSAANP